MRSKFIIYRLVHILISFNYIFISSLQLIPSYLDLIPHFSYYNNLIISSSVLDTSNKWSNVIKEVSETGLCLKEKTFNDVIPNLDKFLLSGAFAGAFRALSRGLTFPFDTIKTFQQSEIENKIITNKGEVPKSINYFNGLFLTLVSAVPANALFFLFYNSLTLYSTCFLGDGEKSSLENLIQRIIISAIATFPQNAIKIPAELVKQRAQIRQTSDVILLIKESVKDKGIQGLYVGGYAQLLREIPYNSFQMAFYELFMDNMKYNLIFKAFYNEIDKGLLAAILGLIAASLSAILTQPADVIKSRLMTRNNKNILDNNSADVNIALDNNSYNSNNIKSGFLDTVIEIFNKEGLSGFFIGLKPRLLIVSIGGLSYFFAANLIETNFDNIKDLL